MSQNQPSARVLAHSINAVGSELITFEITCHRWILAEINTHRMLSRNFRSSRAVPFKKLCEEVLSNPAMPIMWGKNKPGMQSTELMDEIDTMACYAAWKRAANKAVDEAEELDFIGLHKQWVNRILEPFLWVHGVISGTEWSNFYARRRAADAQPEFKALADAMWQVHKASKPVLLHEGEWHLPYFQFGDFVPNDHRLKLSVARVARVSYKPHTNEDTNLAAEFERHDRLLANGHMSPFEHQARPRTYDEYEEVAGQGIIVHDGLPLSNFDDSWVQYRKLIPGENITNYNPNEETT
jgi:thymidylate synthase ThyX